ncbi:MAG: hypothetical protein ACYT04_09835 [Nostoc sp.]
MPAAGCANGGSRRSDLSVCRASCYNSWNPPSGSPVAYGGKPAYSAGFTATHWLLCASVVCYSVGLCVSPKRN